jgi:hypothetical protein
MYKNIPVTEIIKIIENSLSNNDKISTKYKQDIMLLIQIITEKNYLQFIE